MGKFLFTVNLALATAFTCGFAGILCWGLGYFQGCDEIDRFKKNKEEES